MHDTIGTRPRRTVARAGLLFALFLGGCSAGSDGTAELTTARGDGDSGATSDGIVDDVTTSTTAAATPTTSPPPTSPPPTSPPPTSPPTTKPPTTAPPTTVARPLAAARPAPTTTAAPPPPTTTAPKPAASSSQGQCHASYRGTCIPPDVSDADCAGGSGDGPWYVQEKNVSVVGPDVFDLDRDGNGVGCQS